MNEISTDTAIGNEMYQWLTDLFPLCRSLTGEGNRKTISYLRNLVPGLKIYEVPTGTKAFDWQIPDEWNIQDAYVSDENGNRIIDFKQNNLHIVSYSIPLEKTLLFEELDNNLHSLPEQPNAIPYVCSYYQKNWGFCISHNQREELRKRPKQKYHIKIDTTLAPGNMTYGEIIIPGETEQEILLTTYICHPSMANNELSGIVVTTALARWIEKSLPNRRYTYRILFMPETIGAIYYLSKHHVSLKKNVIAGYVVTCIGDNRTYSYLGSRNGHTLADKVAKHVLSKIYPNYNKYTFLQHRGSDERQYCSPGIDLPVCSISRSKYNEYPEYHTSLDNLDLVSPEGLLGGWNILKNCIEVIESNKTYKNNIMCEPQLGRRSLYPHLSTKNTRKEVDKVINILAYTDGEHDLLTLAEMLNLSIFDLISLVETLQEHELITAI